MFLIVLLACPFAPLAAQAQQVEQRISFPERANQYVNVNLRMPVQADSVDLMLPNWTPGSYLIRGYAAQVERLRVSNASGDALEVHKAAKNRWRVQTAGESEISVEYSVWAGELSVSSSWVESAFALLNGTGIFFYSDSSRHWPQVLTVELPPEWGEVATAMIRLEGNQRFGAADYDELVDSPILAGNLAQYRFHNADQEFVLVNQGETVLWDGPKSAEDVSRIVTAVQSFWRVNPFDRPYYFLNVIANGNGGLEHDDSTVLLCNTWQMRYRQEYVRWLAMVTHEFFHAWNVRRMRPEAFNHYDYEQETYTRELWLAEGLSSYYDNLLLLRSGLIQVNEYFALLASEIHLFETGPGRQLNSAESASFDTWIRLYHPDANSINSGVSYYRKGSIIGFVTDMEIRRKTRNKSSLDSVMRELYERYGPDGSRGSGYPPGAFQALIGEIAGPEVRERVDRMITGVGDLDIDPALAWYGLQLDRAATRTAALAAELPVPAGFGLVWDTSSPLLMVQSVLRGGTGAAAGILPADELLAINDTRVTRDNIDDRLLRLEPGETVELLLVRHGSLLRLPVEVQDALPDKFLITINPGITRTEKDRMSQWLGIELKFVTN